VTHLIAIKSECSEKFKMALKLKLNIIHFDWLVEIEEKDLAKQALTSTFVLNVREYSLYSYSSE
jgi:hypothetical protein